MIEQRVAEMKDFGTVRFAMKALSNIAVLNLIRKLGVLVDCVSEGEIVRAMAAGYKPDAQLPEIVYTCDIFDSSSLDFVIKHKVAVNVGSVDMIHQYGPRAARKGITLRINPGFGHGHSQKTNTGGPSSKHGIWHESLDEALAAAKKYGLLVEGVHMHIGSGTDLEHLALVCDAMKKAALEIGPSVRMISAGGGLPVPYRDGEENINLPRYKELWWEVRDQLAAEFGHGVTLEAEPGRYFVCEAGFLVTEIRAVKTMGGNTFYLVDAGFNNLVRPVMYGAHHHISICPRDGESSHKMHSVAVGGPLCESGDVFTQSEGGYLDPRPLAEAKVGDCLIIHNAGAYGASMESNYNSKPRCAEVLIAQGKGHLIRERQPLESLFAFERIPDCLR
jgi:diaminopimelate decarboxylase